MKTSSLPPLCSIPFFAFKEKVNDSDQCQHQCPCKDITISPSQFRHPLEIHSPDTCQKSQWNKNSRNNGQLLHNGIHTLVIVRKVKVYQS